MKAGRVMPLPLFLYLEEVMYYGVAIMDERDIGRRHPILNRWVLMLQRCYSGKFHEKQPTYKGCEVCEDWLTFSNFKRWVETQDWEGKQLDKDILVPENRVYSPDTCVFVDQALNAFLTARTRFSGRYPTGTYYKKKINKFQAQCMNPFIGKNEYLGVFDCPEEAHLAWKKRKHELACVWADMQTDERVANALRNRYK